MGYKNTDDYHSETAMDQLADSVLGLSDEAIVGEIEEAGFDAHEEAERTRSVLRRMSRLWEVYGWFEESEAIASRRQMSSLKR